jgi:hypothetical protein
MPHENSTVIGSFSTEKRMVLQTTILPESEKLIRKRQLVIEEIISTEQSYVDSLRILSDF